MHPLHFFLMPFPCCFYGNQILKTCLVVIVGFVYSILSTSFAVMGVQSVGTTQIPSLSPSSLTTSGVSVSTTTSTVSPSSSGKKLVNAKSTSMLSNKPKPFSDQTTNFFAKGSLVLGLLSVAASRTKFEYSSQIQSLFLGVYTFYSYVWGARLPTTVTKLVHPLVTSSTVLLLSCQLLAKATGQDFFSILRSYKVGSLHPMKTGPGDVLLYLLGPSVVSFAISIYSRRQLLKTNLLVIVTAMLVSSIGGLFGTAAFVRLISLGGQEGSMLRLSVLARNVTTALAIAVTALLGGDISIAASAVCLTGIIGATYGKALLNLCQVQNPIARGLGIGSSSQGLGVAALSDEPDAFPFAAVSMVLNAISATTIVSIPALRHALIKLATGK
jgi:putative effector of murein hydrolase